MCVSVYAYMCIYTCIHTHTEALNKPTKEKKITTCKKM